MIRCRTARAHVDAALERALGLEQRFRLEAHVAGCPACAEYERRARALQELLEGPGDPLPVAPNVDAGVRGVLAALASPPSELECAWRPPAERSRTARRARLASVAAVALACAAAGLLLLLARSGPARRDEAAPEVALPAAPSLGPPAAEETPGVEPPGDAWSFARVDVEVRAALLASFAVEVPRPERARAAERFVERTREAARAGWPVRRFVEELLDSPDVGVARSAATCLGALGDPGSAPALERALARGPLAYAALEALGDLGTPSTAALERALREPALATHAVLQLCRVGGQRAAEALERAARAAGPRAEPSRAALLDALTATGPAAVAPIIRLAASEPDRGVANTVLARLALVEDAGPALMAALESERPRLELACRALAIVRPAAGVPWLEERCASSRERPYALDALAEMDGSAPLGATLRLARAGRVPRGDALELLVRLLERDPGRATAFTAELDTATDAGAKRDWLELLIESAHPGAAPALVRLAADPLLAADDRQWAALAVGELGTRADGELLLAELVRHRGSVPERRAFAAGVLSVHALLGAEGVERLLDSCSSTIRARVQAALAPDGRSGPAAAGERAAVNLHRVARALDGALAELAETSAAHEIL